MRDFITRIALRGAGLGTEVTPREPEPAVLLLPVAERPGRPAVGNLMRDGQRPPSADPSVEQGTEAVLHRRDPEPVDSPPVSVRARSGSEEGKPVPMSPKPNAAMTDEAVPGAQNRPTDRHVTAVHRAESVPPVEEVPVAPAVRGPAPVEPAEPPERLQAPERVGPDPNVRSASYEEESATAARPERGRSEPEHRVEAVVPVRPPPQPLDARLNAAVRTGEGRQASVLVDPNAVSGPTIEVTIGSVEIIAPEPDLDPAPPPTRPAPDFRYMDAARSYADRRWY
jgi:hypothetical protein